MRLCVLNPKLANLEANYFKKKITENSYENFLIKVSKEDKIEDASILGIHMRENLISNQDDKYFKKLNIFEVNFTKVPFDFDNVLVQDYVVCLIKEINENVNTNTKTKENKLFFILNFIFLNKNYELIQKINFINFTQKK